MWFIGVEVEQETSAPPPEKDPGSAPVFYGNSKLKLNSELSPINGIIKDKINILHDNIHIEKIGGSKMCEKRKNGAEYIRGIKI